MSGLRTVLVLFYAAFLMTPFTMAQEVTITVDGFDVSGDEVRFDRENGLMELEGNVSLVVLAGERETPFGIVASGEGALEQGVIGRLPVPYMTSGRVRFVATRAVIDLDAQTIEADDLHFAPLTGPAPNEEPRSRRTILYGRPGTAQRPPPAACVLQDLRYSFGALVPGEDEDYRCVRIFREDAVYSGVAWVPLEKERSQIILQSGGICTLPESLRYSVGAVAGYDGSVYRCVNVLGENLAPSGTAWIEVVDGVLTP